jgi:hypothetical protein
MDGSCAALENPSKLNFAISIVLAIGMVVSYAPQHVRVIRRKTSEGISPWFLLLGITSGICAVCNIYLLGGPIYNCCGLISIGDCFASTLGMVQVTIQASMAGLM